MNGEFAEFGCVRADFRLHDAQVVSLENRQTCCLTDESMRRASEPGRTMKRSQTARTGPESTTRQRHSTETSGVSSTAIAYARSALHSGALAGLLGVITAVRARRTLLAGSTDDATRQSMLAVFWLGVAMTQWGINRSARQESRAEAIDVTDLEAPDAD